MGTAGSAGAHEAQLARTGFKHCGTKKLYGHRLQISVRGKVRACERVRQIIRGECKDRKRWSCFSFRTPDPPLVWFPSKERFARRWSTVIKASRYPCTKAALTRQQWSGPSQRFPTRKQILSDDIIRCHLLAGMTVHRVESLLGNPTHSYTSRGHPYRDYVIGPERDSFFQIDPELLSVKFSSSGTFTKASIYQGQ